MPVRVNVQVVNDKELIAAFNEVLRHVSNLETVWKIVEPGFRQIMREQFDSEGAAGRSGKWKPLSPGYAKQKRLQYGDKPILQATNRLERSLTGRTGDSLVIINRQSVSFGTSVPYATFHQTGTAKMPRRKIIDLSDDQERFLSDVLFGAVDKDVRSDRKITKMIDVRKTNG